MENNYLLLLLPGLAILGIAFFFLTRKNPSRNVKQQVTLAQKKQITHDSIIFTFLLSDSKKSLGLNIGEHIQIEQTIKGQMTMRKYTPISRIDQKGSFQLLLKIYHPNQQFPNGGMMSSYLESLELNKKITITLPYGRFNYVGKSYVQITDLQKNVTKTKYKRFYMIAGGTGITPIYQLIQYMCENEKENQMPQLTLLFANRSEDDILLESNLKNYAAKCNKFKIFFSVDRSITDNWQQLVGFVDKEKISKTIPEIDGTLCLSCGPPILSNIVEGIWVKMGIKTKDIYRF